MKLLRASDGKTLVPKLELAESFLARARGLLGRTHLAGNEGLWIQQCRSVHTFFMKFPIDLIFVDHGLTVKRTYENVVPFRLVFPLKFGISSVIELPSGFLKQNPIGVGEKLHVDSALS